MTDSKPEPVVEIDTPAQNQITEAVIAKVEARLVDEDTRYGTCRVYSGAKNKDGYGNVRVGHKFHRVHKLLYEWYRGPVPDGMELDHLCKTRACAELTHLEVVTHRTNQERITQCPNGHPYDMMFAGHRACSICGAVDPKARRNK